MNERNYWDHNVEGDAVGGLVSCVHRDEVMHTLIEMKTGKALDVSLDLIANSMEVGIQVVVE